MRKNSVIIAFVFLVLGVLLPLMGNAAILSTQGRTYTIQEFPMDKLIQLRLQSLKDSGEWAQKMAIAKKKMVDAMQTLPAVSFITETIQPRTFYYTPKIEVPVHINVDGKSVRLPFDDTLNPLAKMKLDETLLFYDARDAQERCWASRMEKKIKGAKKWILVGGNWVKESERLKARVFVDQRARLSKTFHISHTPAILMQEGKRLKIDEVKACEK